MDVRDLTFGRQLPDACAGLKWALDPLELELQTVVSQGSDGI